MIFVFRDRMSEIERWLGRMPWWQLRILRRARRRMLRQIVRRHGKR